MRFLKFFVCVIAASSAWVVAAGLVIASLSHESSWTSVLGCWLAGWTGVAAALVAREAVRV